MSKRDLVKGTVERRVVTVNDFEIRAEGNALSFSGKPSLFNTPYEMYGGPDKGGWIETVNRDAFKRTLAAKPDVVLNMNHGQGGTGLPIARTTSGTLTLRTDSKSLIADASLDLRDPDVQALQVKAERGDLNQMSFAFRTIADNWTNEEANRELMELSLDRGDVSIVTNGANSQTSFQLNSVDDALEMLCRMDKAEFVEVRSAEPGKLVAVHRLLGDVLGKRADDDTDPGAVAQAVDAALDAVEAALEEGNVDQAIALLLAADLSVDVLLGLLGVADADEPGDRSARASRVAHLIQEARAVAPAPGKRMTLAQARRVALLDCH